MLYLVAFAIYGLTACLQYSHIDAHAATVESWRIASAGNPWLESVMDREMQHNKFISEAANGHIVGQRMAGPVLVGIPFYLLLDRNPSRGGFDLLPGGMAASACTAAAVLLLFLSLRTRLGDRTSFLAALVFAFGTPTWSVSANMLWTHPVTQFGLAGAAYAASRRRAWLAGLFLAVGILGRPHIALVAAILGFGMAISRQHWRPLLEVAVPTVSALGVLLVWNHWMFGVWSIGGAYQGRTEAAVSGFHGSSEWAGSHAQLVNYLGFFFSFDRGLFVWTPVLLLLLPSVIRSWRDVPSWSKWLALGGVAYSFVQLRVNYFPGGDGFYGYRHGLELLTCLVPLFASSLPRAGVVARFLVPVISALQVAAIGLGAVTESFFVNIDDVWTDNSLWLAIREDPAAVLLWMSLWLLVGLVGSVWLRRERFRAAGHPGTGAQVITVASAAVSRSKVSG